MEIANDQSEYELNEPRADAMVQSLRAFGYDLSTAIADLVDNSITAGASTVWIRFFWDGSNSTIAVIDDGKGMTEAALRNAMRLGSQSPIQERSADDLGRFGLGLKTASFSQAKSLTVATKCKNEVAMRRWDLDYIAQKHEWRLLTTASKRFIEQGLPFLEDLSQGTVVFWETLDRLVTSSTNRNDERAQALFLDRAERVRAHLAMVFHRFLKPDLPGHRALKIWVGKQEVRAWDPFLVGEPSSRLLSDEMAHVFGLPFTVRPYVLPHHSKLSTGAYKRAEGLKGWNAQQGFYVYRNRRLLVPGSWLGLKDLRQEEYYKLARILVDIPNTMDAGWEIDVKKSRASPPAAIRDYLGMIATKTRAEASKAYRFRGTRVRAGSKRDLTYLWESQSRNGRLTYRINREHQIVAAALNTGGEAVGTLLRFLEETIPVPTIVQHGMENPSAQVGPFENGGQPDLMRTLRTMFARLIAMGESPQDARDALHHMDPFYRFPELIESLGEGPYPHAKV